MTNFPLLSGSISEEMLTSDFSLPPYLLSKIFPFYLTFNQHLQIMQVGEATQQIYPDIAVGSLFQQHFRIHYPKLPLSFEALCRRSHSLIVLQCCYDNVKFSGQLIYAEHQGILVFLGFPWITNSHSLKSIGLKLSDCAIQGSISEFLLLIRARSTSLSDTRRLAERLTEQRAGLYRALRQTELANAVLEQAADAIEITDTNVRLLYVNCAFEKMTGYTREEVLGKTPASLFRAGQHGDDFYEAIWQVVSAGQVWQGSFLGRRKDGSLYHQEATIFPVFNRVNEIVNYVALKRDISDRKQTQDQLERSLSLLQAALESTADGILVVNKTGQIEGFNQKFLEMWQIPASVVKQREDHTPLLKFALNQLKNPDAFLRQVQALYAQPDASCNDLIEFKDGRIFERYSQPQRLGEEIVGRVWSFRDVTDRHRKEATIRYQALHDLLTGLPNRMLFNDRLSNALFCAAQSKTQLAVMFLDLDRFKLINDTLGHAAGDQLLQEVARRLTHCLRESDTVARWAGDEFTLLLPDIYSVDDTVAIAQRILNAINPDFELDGHILHVSSSIGIAIYPTDGEDAETLLKNADAALYRAKEGGRNGYQLYTSAINSAASEWLALEHHLHHALERHEFVLHYQPQVNVVTGKITQIEALLRWQHPTMGLVLPGKFIPLAEETGLIVQIGEWVLRTACTQNKAWQLAGLPPVRMAVNLSARQFRQPKLIDMIQRILQETGLEPRYLELEITETTVMQNVELTQTVLSDLHHMGVSIALDDFGTGYSSLSYLKKFPFHTLKIDQSFIRDLTSDPNDKAIVTAIIAMGKVLNLKLVAEGVETEVQGYLLRSLDCEEMQGYLFSKPVPAIEAAKLLKKAASRTSWVPLIA